jgi:hypothetical protein
MNTQLTSYCLKHMGIDVWRGQYPLPGALQSIDCRCFRLVRTADNGTIGSLLLQVMAVTPQQQQKIQRLMEAMLFAVGLRAETIDKPPPQTDGVILIWGLSVAQKVLQTMQPLAELRQLCQQTASSLRVIVSHHPLELLQQPLLKAKAWQDLQEINY